MFVKHFLPDDGGIYVTEFGHSRIEQSKSVGPWSREMYILHYVTKGACEFSGFCVGQGQAFLIAKGRFHSFTVSDDYEHYWIGFDGEAVGQIFKAFGLECRAHQLFFVDHSEIVAARFAELFQKISGEDGQDAADLSSGILSALTAMLPLLKEEKHAEACERRNYAEQAQRVIESNYMYPIKMSEIADQIHISEKHMYRVFLKRFRMSPQQYLFKTRMKIAKKHLMETDFSVKEVAQSVGYSSPPSFCKAFLKVYGVTPTEVKK
ncbi:MAG: helix-turn-helix domain-containing protein [Clostridia bacterium]|nr:helix-turn-helix domain-containing protein [Clostridia bacterium]